MKITTFTNLFAAIPLFLMGGAQAAAPSRDAAASYGRLPLSFEPNLGQTDPRVQFLARGAGYNIFLSPGAATFTLERHSKAGTGTTVIRMDLAGADRAAPMEPQEKLPGVSNYLMGSTRVKWPTGVSTYAKTRIRHVYPGIDLVYYGTQSQLEYDFVLAPGADPSRIRMTFAGATPVLDESGDLILRPSEIRFHKPVLYQLANGIRQPVSGGFTIAGRNREVGFQVDSFDHSRELVIDPVLLYSSYLGGSAYPTQINGMTVNAAGEMYVTGVTAALDYPTTPGVIETTCPLDDPQYQSAPAGKPKCGPVGDHAAFVSKISANGQSLIYSTYLGGGGNGSDNDWGTGIVVDAGDDAWVVGETNSNDFPITADAYLAYCNPALNGSMVEISACIGNNTRSAFLVQLNPAGTAMLYGTFLGGTGDEGNVAIALDAAGAIYVAGSAYTGEVGPPAKVLLNGQYNYPTTANAYQPIVLGGGHYSAFVSKLSSNGKSLLYSTMFGGPYQSTYNVALAVNAGKIFIGGQTSDPDLPTTPGALSATCVSGPTAAGPNTVCVNGSANGYVAEFDPSQSGAASLVFATYLNGSVSPVGNEMSSVDALAADAAGNVYAGGVDTYTANDGFPATPRALQPVCVVNGECSTGFVTKLSAAGALVWSTFYGSPSTAAQEPGVAAMTLDSSNNVYITGNAQNVGDYPLNKGFQSFEGGGAYLTELSSDGSKVLFGSYYGGAANVYPTGLVVDKAGSIYVAGYSNGGLPLVNAFQSNNNGVTAGVFAKIVGAATATPFGSFDTPVASSASVSGSLGFTGWALSLAGISWVDLWREPNAGEGNNLVYIGQASSITGSRPDVEADYPAYPENTSAGWGFLILTNELPSNDGNTGVGNGTYNIHAIAHDLDGNSKDLGTKTIAVDNKDATAPFGGIDTPAQGGTASGSAYVNFGWALTQPGKMIPTSGSTIRVYIDGAPVGHPVYNNYRVDIATLFPGYANAQGAVGYYRIDTTKLSNGLHTISWSVKDSAGQTAGIGSRYFIVQN